MNHHIDQEVVVGFISEAKGYLPEIMLGLESFAADVNQLHNLREAFRYAHIIKGAASMLGFMQISEVAYQLEVTLEMLCEEHLPLSQELLEDLCQNVGDLAELLDHSLDEAPAEDAAQSSAVALSDEILSTDELSIPELSTSELSTDELSTDELSIPELLIPESYVTEPMELPAALLPVNDFSLPVFALTPSEYEEKGETILLPTEEGEEILPEARATWSSYVPPEYETEEPLVSLLNETSFSVSLPETTETPTIGDLDLNDVAKELKESYGAFPPPPQPEFTLPDELMAGLPELKLEAEPVALQEERPEEIVEKIAEEIAEELPLDLLPVEEICAEAASETARSEILPEVLPNVLEDSEPSAPLALNNLADQCAEDWLPAPESMPQVAPPDANILEGDSFVAEAVGEAVTPTLPDFEMESLPEPAFDEALPELTAFPNLPEMTAPADFDQQLAYRRWPAFGL